MENIKPARRFWRSTIVDVENGIANVFVPREVIRELTNQSFSFIKFRNSPELINIADIIRFSTIIDNITTPEIEELIIEFSAYVTAEFREELMVATGLEKLKYPSIPDARILCTSWQHDFIMVTGNIKDFILLPLLEAPDQDKLYNILTHRFVKIPPTLHTKIHRDTTFTNYFNSLIEKIDNYNS
ncbi:DUF4411 family protein [Bacillus sp. LL01]|uniref:DUF4411 family protein n=1 Tax=Bacillus sp. LL01 TaxID=1665556 RepID=UPI001F51D226